jgi:hypothetical protein
VDDDVGEAALVVRRRRGTETNLGGIGGQHLVRHGVGEVPEVAVAAGVNTHLAVHQPCASLDLLRHVQTGTQRSPTKVSLKRRQLVVIELETRDARAARHQATTSRTRKRRYTACDLW